MQRKSNEPATQDQCNQEPPRIVPYKEVWFIHPQDGLTTGIVCEIRPSGNVLIQTKHKRLLVELKHLHLKPEQALPTSVPLHQIPYLAPEFTTGARVTVWSEKHAGNLAGIVTGARICFLPTPESEHSFGLDARWEFQVRSASRELDHEELGWFVADKLIPF
jgi:hypothetical protein